MEIRDVIGSLREKDLEIIRKIDAIRLDIHLLEYRVSKLEHPGDVSRETEEESGSYQQDPLPGLESTEDYMGPSLKRGRGANGGRRSRGAD